LEGAQANYKQGKQEIGKVDNKIASSKTG
jgi:hypothetical protein